MPKRGAFIALEGGEGAGKGSVLVALEALLRRRGVDPVVTREPGGAPGAEAIRALIVERGVEWTARCELLLLMADRAQHVEKVIGPALEAGRWVLCDRYVASTFAYQGAGKGLPDQFIAEAQRLAAGSLEPDFSILLDVDPRIGLRRSARRLRTAGSTEDRFESLDLGFHQRVRARFLKLAHADPERWIVIDAGRALEAVIEEVERRASERIDARLE